GSNLNAGSRLRFNGVDHAVTFISTTEVHAQIAANEIAVPGIVPVEILNPAPGGGISLTQNFTIINTGPTVSSLAPANAVAGGPAFTLTVNGTNFDATSVVLWNGVSRTTTLVSSTQLTAQITAADIQSAGSFAVTVSNSGGTPSNALNFIVNNPLPQITAITPTSVSSGGPSFTLTVNGTGFVPGSVVRFNGNLAANDRPTVFDNNTQLTATITAADIAAPGAFPITVFTPLPGGGVSNAINLTVENPAPIITSLTPASMTAGAADFTLSINGSNFNNNSVVRVDGIDSATTFVSSSALSVQILAAKVASPGAISIGVFNPGAGISNSIQLQVSNPQPVISNISPVSKTAGDSAFTLTVNGTGFNGTSVARLSGNDRPTTFVSSSQLDVQLSAADLSSAGLYPITVFNPAPGGGTSSAINLTVNNPVPVIANLAPSSLLQGATTTQVTVNGTGFVSGSVVAWNGQSRSTTFVSPTQLNFQVTDSDLNVEGVASVTVNNPAPGGGNSAPSPFSVNMNPRRVSVVSSSGFSGGSASVTIQLTAQGDENALGFTLFYDTAILSNPTVSLGADSADASLNINTSEVGAGHYGVALSLPAGMTFSAGARQVVIVNFDVAAVPSGTQTQITFGDQPITREVANITAEVLPTAFVPGSITVSDGVEADVAPRPNGSGNGMVTVSDWVQIGRFVAGIDTVASSGEMQRADCAPRSSLGNGALTISDWVQAGRYAAALDTVLPAGGPMTIPSGVFEAKDSGDMHANSVREPSINVPRSVRMTVLQEQGQERSIAIELDSYGTENGLGFSLMFDPSKLRFRSAENGANAESATLQINQASADKGRLGVALVLPVGHSFNAGTNQIVILKFIELQPEGQPSGVTFTDLPIKRELVSVDAGNLVAGFDGLPEVNSLDNAQYFVYRQYLDLLGRLPDSEGLDYWTEQISSCGTDEACVRQRRVAVSNAFLLGREFQQTSGFILRMYRAGLGIRPTYAQFIKERSSLMTGMQIENGKTEFANYLVQLPEFELLFPRTTTPTQYVDGLNANTGNALTPSQRAAFIDGLQSGNESRASVLRQIADNPVFADREFNSSFVLMQYFGYLKRDPDAEGFAFWLDQLVPFGSRARETQRAMVWSFITSSDYQMRFSSAGGDCRRSGQNRDCLVEPGIER
ncbi:MAG TPA: hypothetical protein VFV61_01950, partial [Pyrinomonadaceae bacterium]|nr:hypothetical protein [Pyrinomonadaceae bacterium]